MSSTISGTEPGQRQLNGPQTSGREYRNLSLPEHSVTHDLDVAAPMRDGVELLVDVHRRPVDFGFAQLIAAAFDAGLPSPAAPSAVSYRVGATAATGGRMLGVWQQALRTGEALPAMPLTLANEFAVTVDLEPTYTRAATDCYL